MVSTDDDNDWKFLVEVSCQREEEVNQLLETFHERGIEFHTTQVNKPVWEPLPLSTIEIYVRKKDVQISKDLIKDSEVKS